MQKVALSAPQRAIVQSRKAVHLFLAGQGSGKTFTAGYMAARFVRQFPHLHGFIAANTHMQLTDSTLKGIFKAWELFGLKAYDSTSKSGDYVWDKKPPAGFATEGHYFRTYRNKVCFKNGAVIFIGSLENYKAHDGKEFAWALLDETKDTREEAIREVILGRLRQAGLYVSEKGNFVKKFKKGRKSVNPLYVFTSPAKVDWINQWFELDRFHDEIVRKIFSKDDFFHKEFKSKSVTISSTYLNQAHLPEGFIEQMKANLPSSLQDMLIYGCPFARSGGEFYKQFRRNHHVEEVAHLYTPTEALHISFDFNVAPYITLTIWQAAGYQLVQLGELCLSSPQNTVIALCRAFQKKYPTHEGGLFVYGDPSGHQRNVLVKGTYFDIIQKELRAYHPQLKLFSAAPAVVQRNIFVNGLLAEELEAAPALRFDPSCKHSIADLQFLKEQADGTKSKEKTTDRDTGSRVEKYGHTSDANDYFLCKYLEEHFLRLFGKSRGNYRLGYPGARKQAF